MDELDKIKSQIDNGQGLTCAQARLLWGAYSVANRYAAYAAESCTSIPCDWLARQNSSFPASEQDLLDPALQLLDEKAYAEKLS